MISVDLVMTAWKQGVAREEPWCSMPPDDRTGELRRLVEELLDPAGGLGCPTRRRRIRLVATCHGAFRGAQRCPEPVLLNDFAVLRDALRRVLWQGGTPRIVARDFVRALLPDWQLARRTARTAHTAARRATDDSCS